MIYRNRRREWNGNVYLIRDVIKDGKLLRVEYGSYNEAGKLRWTETYEGVLWASIQPKRKPAHAP